MILKPRQQGNIKYRTIQWLKRRKRMPKLKDLIQDEINKVKDKLISSSGDKTTLKEWLQSLQQIDNVCKDRNRY